MAGRRDGSTLDRPEEAGATLSDEGARLASFASGVTREEDRGIRRASGDGSRWSGDGAKRGPARPSDKRVGPARPSAGSRGGRDLNGDKAADEVTARRRDVAALTGASRAAKHAAGGAARGAAEAVEEKAGLGPAGEQGETTFAGTSTGSGAASLSDATLRRRTTLQKATYAAKRGVTDRVNDEFTAAVRGDRESTLYASSGENKALSILSNAGDGGVAQVSRTVKRFRTGRARLSDLKADKEAARATGRLMAADRERLRRAKEGGASDEVKEKLKKRASRRVTDHIRSTMSAGGTVTGHGLGLRVASGVRAIAGTAARGVAAAATSLVAVAGPWLVPLGVALALFVFLFAGGWGKSSSGGVGSIDIPEPYGTRYEYTEYDKWVYSWGVTPGTAQEVVAERWKSAGAVFTDGIATIDGRYLIACTATFGQVGDEVDFYLDDGTRLPCIIADDKNSNDAGYNKWGHHYGQGVVEFEVSSEYAATCVTGDVTYWKTEWAGKRVVSATNRTSGGPADDGNGDLRSKAIAAAKSLLGESYTWNDAVGEGFSCNGLTWYAWGQAGIEIPHFSGNVERGNDYGQFQYMKDSGNWVSSESDLLPGDLVFYSHDEGVTIFHVAMYLGDGQVIQSSPQSNGVSIVDINWCSGFCGGGSPLGATGSGTNGSSSTGGGWDWWSGSKSSTSGSFGGGESYAAATEQQKRIVDACKSTPSPGAGLCATWVSDVYEAAGMTRPGGNGNSMLDGCETSTDWSKIQVGQVVSAQHSTTDAAEDGYVYGHVAIYVGGGQVMDSVGYIRTMSLEDWVSEYGRYGWVKYGWPYNE